MDGPLAIAPGVEIPAAELSVETSRSGGPGGQHVNTADTRVRLRWSMAASAAVSDEVKARLRERFPSLVTDAGEVLVTSQTHRSQIRNLEEARDRLADVIRGCLRAPRPRRPTRPTRGSQERRIAAKKVRKSVKDARKKIGED